MKWALPLNEQENGRLYWELARRGAFCSGIKNPWPYEDISEEELLTLAVAQSRYDPRLLEILVEFFCKSRSEINPILFKEIVKKHGLLSVMAVVGELVLICNPSASAKELVHFLRIGAQHVPTQLFYRGLYRIAGKKMQAVIARPLWVFKKWGFLAADMPLLKEKQTQKRYYLFDRKTRENILKDLAEQTPRFFLKDYLHEINFSISRQQALKDISAAAWLTKRGHGKGAYYRLTSRRGT